MCEAERFKCLEGAGGGVCEGVCVLEVGVTCESLAPVQIGVSVCETERENVWVGEREGGFCAHSVVRNEVL